ncbi:cell envelope-related transcriptional attenuator [Paenibacillus hunanensis]|uniref:LCP family protein required for cell wall assembly n=1 Tax=Paenibacillus hunanensis TaxID=539262 RepID=A0ABU1IT92_9BACL|nr:LCP family protein required for cell wall assembly [Paenibacillus hunanensis]GGJ08075.1 cell envelope-related transcriptional attenuator [Paenibacillus hunanensis]
MIKSFKAWKWFLLVVLLAGGGIAGYYAYSIAHFASSISTAQQSNPNTDPSGAGKGGELPDIPEWDGTEPVHLLLLGTDSRDTDSNGRSDSMMVATIDPVTKRTYLMSILRDTYVDIPGHGYSRINAAYSYGGAPLAMETVGRLLGIPIDHYVKIDFEGFKSLVDTVDGVEIDVEKDMKYTDGGDGHRYDIDLKKGVQTLDGTHALQYVRFRHDATSDFTRTERQRKFLTALAAKLQSSSSLLKLPSILNGVAPYIETNMSTSTMLKLARLGLDVNVSRTEKVQIPPNSLLEAKTVRGAAVLGVDEVRLRKYIEKMLNDSDEENEESVQE